MIQICYITTQIGIHDIIFLNLTTVEANNFHLFTVPANQKV